MIRFMTKQSPNSLTHCARHPQYRWQVGRHYFLDPKNLIITTSLVDGHPGSTTQLHPTCAWGTPRLRRFHQPYGHRLNTARHTRFLGSSSIAGPTRCLPRGLAAATLQPTLITHIACPLNINAWYRIRWGRTSNQGNWYALRQRAVVAGPIPRD